MKKNKAYQFDMISRTVGDELPYCVFYPYDETLECYVVKFYGSLEALSDIPIRLDFSILNNVLVSDARQVEICKNGAEYVAEYHAYAIHIFEDAIPL